MNVIEVMETCIAMRYLKEDPLPRETLQRLVYAATRASNPGNSQGWQFVVIDDRAVKEAIGAEVARNMASAFATKPEGLDAVQSRMYAGAEHLAANFARVPAWILGGGRKVYPPQAPQDIFLHSTIYPAAQNLVVAARSLNIGACFTTFHQVAEPVIRKVCAVPDDVHLGVLIAVGYPLRPFTKVRRQPLQCVLHWNRFS